LSLLQKRKTHKSPEGDLELFFDSQQVPLEGARAKELKINEL
jgi:hypothetical protein